MPINYQNKIFGLFSKRDWLNDVNKDVNGKGTNQRTSESVGKTLDDDITPYIDELVDRIVNVHVADVRFIGYLEQGQGAEKLTNTTFSTEAYRRAVLSHVRYWQKIKVTPKLLRILLGMLGLEATITTVPSTAGFDNDTITFDDPERVFDGACNECSNYVIDIIGEGTEMGVEVFQAFMACIAFNEPMDAHFFTGTYNGNFIVYQIISIVPDGQGGFSYSNPYDPALVIELIDGDYVVTGGLSQFYVWDEDTLVFQVGSTPDTFYITTEGGDVLNTENGDRIVNFED